jgi:hypothetical protein
VEVKVRKKDFRISAGKDDNFWREVGGMILLKIRK